jgi:hypothetical protein
LRWLLYGGGEDIGLRRREDTAELERRRARPGGGRCGVVVAVLLAWRRDTWTAALTVVPRSLCHGMLNLACTVETCLALV